MVLRGGRRGVPRTRVPLEEFLDDEHLLSSGFLQRSAAHANLCHQEDLRAAVAAGIGAQPDGIAAVTMHDLTPERVELRWIDASGASSRILAFPRRATTAVELGEMLRRRIHLGIC